MVTPPVAVLDVGDFDTSEDGGLRGQALRAGIAAAGDLATAAAVAGGALVIHGAGERFVLTSSAWGARRWTLGGDMKHRLRGRAATARDPRSRPPKQSCPSSHTSKRASGTPTFTVSLQLVSTPEFEPSAAGEAVRAALAAAARRRRAREASRLLWGRRR